MGQDNGISPKHAQNAYAITEGGETKIWIAPTMTQALEMAWTDYLREQIEEDVMADTEEEERRYYENDVLQSCAFVGEVGELRPSQAQQDHAQTISEIDNTE